MTKLKRRGFTLIELIAVLVILAILALIITPLVMNIIRKVKIANYKRSVDAYGRSVELAIASYLLDNGAFPTDLKGLKMDYSGKKVVCNVMIMKENGDIYMSQCSVNGKDVLNSKEEDGYYHYGISDYTIKEYVDMYGKSLEQALKEYKELNGEYPSDYHSLTLNYTGEEVSCDVSVNYNGKVYMTNCSVSNIKVKDDTEDGYYHYGDLENYHVGEEYSYNGEVYYVIKDSPYNEETVTLLKYVPLTVDEVNTYGVGHINNYTKDSVGVPYGIYAQVAYYGSQSCGYINDSWVHSGCSTLYANSDIKYIVDAWAADKINVDDLRVDSTGYSVRLITASEYDAIDSSYSFKKYASWNYYWTMSSYVNFYVFIGGQSKIGADVAEHHASVRPVITITKSALN